MLNTLKTLKSKILEKYDTSKVTNILHEKSYVRTLVLLISNFNFRTPLTVLIVLLLNLLLGMLISLGIVNLLLYNVPKTPNSPLHFTTTLFRIKVVLSLLSTTSIYTLIYTILALTTLLYLLKVIHKNFSLIFLTLILDIETLIENSYMQPLKTLNYIEYSNKILNFIATTTTSKSDTVTLVIVGDNKYREKVKKWLETK